MQISTVPSRTAGTNTLLCGSAAVEASKLPSFNPTGRCLSNLPLGFSTPPPQVILVLLFRKMKYECRVLRWMEIDSRNLSKSKIYQFLCPRDAFILYLVLQEFQQLQAGFNMFRSVTFLYMAGVPRHRQMPFFIYACIMHPLCRHMFPCPSLI